MTTTDQPHPYEPAQPAVLPSPPETATCVLCRGSLDMGFFYICARHPEMHAKDVGALLEQSFALTRAKEAETKANEPNHDDLYNMRLDSSIPEPVQPRSTVVEEAPVVCAACQQVFLDYGLLEAHYREAADDQNPLIRDGHWPPYAPHHMDEPVPMEPSVPSSTTVEEARERFIQQVLGAGLQDGWGRPNKRAFAEFEEAVATAERERTHALTDAATSAGYELERIPIHGPGNPWSERIWEALRGN